jgi:hypothetical protein
MKLKIPKIKLGGRKYHSNLPFIDLLFNTLIGFFFLFVIAFLMVNIQTKKADIRTKAEYIITLTWETKTDEDVDMWLEDPLGNKMFFRNKEIPMAHLDRDDRGNATDEVTLGDGTKIVYPENQEIGTIRGFIPGEWVLNIHLFRRGSENKEPSDPFKVTIKMQKINPSVKLVLNKNYNLDTYWQEITVARFTMRADGEILEWSDLYKKVIVDGGTPGSIADNHLVPGTVEYRNVSKYGPDADRREIYDAN